jgi:ATP synthase protein I
VAGLTNKKQAYQIIYCQLGLTVLLALTVLLFKGAQNAMSALLGGLAYWMPTLLFVWRVFARGGAQAAKQFLLLFVAGESIKLLMSGLLFVLVVKYLPVNLMYVLIGFVGAVIAFWIASMFILARHEGVSE